MSLKSKLAELELKDPKLKSFLNDLADSVEIVRNNLIISDYESKAMEMEGEKPPGFIRLRPPRLLLDEIKFTDDLNSLALRSSNSMRAQARTNTTIPIQNNAFQTLDWAVESFDTDDMFSSGAPTRFTVQHDGTYLVSATITFIASTGGTTRLLGIRRMAANMRCFGRICIPPQGTSAVSLQVTGIQGLTKGQYVEAFCYQDTGAPLNLDTTFSADAAYSFFQIHRLS